MKPVSTAYFPSASNAAERRLLVYFHSAAYSQGDGHVLPSVRIVFLVIAVLGLISLIAAQNK